MQPKLPHLDSYRFTKRAAVLLWSWRELAAAIFCLRSAGTRWWALLSASSRRSKASASTSSIPGRCRWLISTSCRAGLSSSSACSASVRTTCFTETVYRVLLCILLPAQPPTTTTPHANALPQLQILVPCSEAGGLAHGILDTKELLLFGVLIRFGDRHWCSKVGLQDVLLAEENLSLLVDALDLPRIQARRLPAMTTSDTERCHPVVPLHGKGHQVYLKQISIFTVIVCNVYK
nr:uncharacterized protein LOC129448179 [Misgurnus anguillicaudatus]